METGIRRDAETRERRRVPCYRITGGSTEYTISTLFSLRQASPYYFILCKLQRYNKSIFINY